MLVNIPKPCHQDWYSMTPTQKGAFCGSCAKEVVDFTKMSDDEVLQYVKNNTGQRICGRVSKAQLKHIAIHIPEAVFVKRLAIWKKFLAVIIVCFSMFMTGCSVGGEQQSVKGEIQNSTNEKNGLAEGAFKEVYSISNTERDTPQEIKSIPDCPVAPVLTSTVEHVTVGAFPTFHEDLPLPPPPPPPPPVIDEMIDGMIIMPETIKDTTTNQKPFSNKKDTTQKCNLTTIT